MKPIQPVNVWFNGQQIEANNIIVNSSYDDLSTSVSFNYSLVNSTSTTGSYMPIEILTRGNLNMTGSDYQNWNNTPDINDAAYVWVADQLNLTLV